MAIIIGIWGTVGLFQSHRQIAAIIFLIGAILVFVYFGMRWFEEGGIGPGNVPKQWPPIVNTCPDFLTYYEYSTGSGVSAKTYRACIDTIGVSTKPSALAKWVVGTTVAPTEYSETDTKVFNLQGADGVELTNKKKCDAAIAAGLAWEGITDGFTCTYAGRTGDEGAGNTCK